MSKLTLALAALVALAAAGVVGCSTKSEMASENTAATIEVSENAVENAADTDSNAMAGEEVQRLPEFKLPAPRASAQAVLPRAALPPGEPSLQEVDDSLRARLRTAGYDELGYYRVTNGFALATKMERIGADGRPFLGVKRWQTEASGLASFSGSFSIRDMMNALLRADPGSYRVMVFVVTNRNVTSSGPPLSSDVAKVLVSEGASALPQAFEQVKFRPDYRVTVLIYEFNRSAVGKPAEFSRPSTRSASEQLRLAKVLQA